MNESKSIKNWNEDDRPREKMLHKGAASLSDAELIAILIVSGTPEYSALDLARKTLEMAHYNLHELGRLSISDMQKTKGIGEARAITIAAAMELGRRRQMSDAMEQTFIKRSKDAAAIFVPLLQDLHHEVCCVLYLSQSGRLIKHEMLSSGGISSTVVDVRVILKNCLLYSATSLMIAHNHPGGGTKPSHDDIALTKKLHDSAAIMSIKMIDHIIVAGTDYVSMADEGFM